MFGLEPSVSIHSVWVDRSESNDAKVFEVVASGVFNRGGYHMNKPNPKQTSKTIARKTRASIIRQLAELLWDQSKPDGEEAVPED